MKREKIIILLLLAMALGHGMQMQAQTDAANLSERAQMRYPRSTELPSDVVWTREIYRTLDLTKGNNGSLYYPVEPIDNRMNLFSLIFKLVATKKVNAYEYQLDGVERFSDDKAIQLRDILDRFGIYYEQKKVKGRKDSVLVVDNSDVPSADVLSYFIKEVWYFDQRTSDFGSTVTAICPVMHRAEDFSFDKVKLPMFWVKYQDLAPYLANAAVMTSDYNNTLNSSMDDFFASKMYDGDIYKTTNLRNIPLAQYCETDSDLVKEQQRIEGELVRFEKNLYGPDTIDINKKQAVDGKKKAESKQKAEAADNDASASNAAAGTADRKSATSNSRKKTSSSASSSRSSSKSSSSKSSSSKSSKSSSVKKSSSSSSRSAGAPKASVRRERR